MRTTLLSLCGLALVVALAIPIQSAAAEESPRPDQSMEVIRQAAHNPEVESRLKERGITEQQIDRRLARLDQNLDDEQKLALANRIRQSQRENPKVNPDTPGDGFVVTTLDVLTEIILFPLKVLAWIIPGL